MIVVIQNVGRVNVAALTEAIPSVATTITGLRVPMSPAQEEIRRPMSSVSSHSTEATESPTPGLLGGNNPAPTDTGTAAPILLRPSPANPFPAEPRGLRVAGAIRYSTEIAELSPAEDRYLVNLCVWPSPTPSSSRHYSGCAVCAGAAADIRADTAAGDSVSTVTVICVVGGLCWCPC